jgi:hypothetical protein
MVILIEHQSTIDKSMPLRILSYIVRIYEKIIDESILREDFTGIARPEFIVLYNGKDPFPEKKFLKLSDLFVKLDEFEKNEYSDLIWLDSLVLMLNINKGHNLDLERKSETLSGYNTFVAKVREYEKKYALKKAVKSAVEYCIKKNILIDYFKQNSSEEVSMNFLKYDEKVAIKVAREEAREKGIIEGMEKGMMKGMEKGMVKGKKEIQNYILDLIEQGLSSEQIKKKIESKRKKTH